MRCPSPTSAGGASSSSRSTASRPASADSSEHLLASSPVSVPNTGTEATVPPGRLVSERVFAQLLEALLAGRYAEGEKLPTQRVLAADLGVTLSSVREALKRLEQMGLL